jgi:DNA-binding transcriptional ArsR family regulator
VTVNVSRLNAVGDLVVTDARALRALADPSRRQLFQLVQRLGPITAAALAVETGAGECTLEEQLLELERLGLIDSAGDQPSGRLWSTPAKGIYFEIPPDGEEAQRAARDLGNAMVADAAELPSKWVRDEEPSLELEWARAAGLFNARIQLTPSELQALQDQLEQLLMPFTTRAEADRPPGAAPVRITAFFLPEPRDERER